MNTTGVTSLYDVLVSVRLHLRGMWRFRWHALWFAWILCLIGWCVVYTLRDQYEVRAKVFVDSDTVLERVLEGPGLTVRTDVLSQVNMMTQALLSRPVLEQAARETDLHRRAETPKELERLIEDLRLKINIDGGRNNVYTISYIDSDRNTAYKLVQTLLTAFVEDSVGANRQDSTNAQRFLEKQIEEYEKRLRDAERKLADFKKRNVGLMPGNRGDYYSRLQDAMADLQETRTQYNLASMRREELRKQLAGEVPTFGLLGSNTPGAGTGTALDQKIDEYKKRLEELLLQYTEKHPDVIALNEAIANLEQQKQQRGSGSAPTPQLEVDPDMLAITSLDLNPVYQQIKISLSETEVQLVELRQKLAEQQAEVERLQELVDTIPEVEAELASLNRDYEVNRNQHRALLQQLERTRLSEEVEESSDEIQFRVIEPPLMPVKPAGPDRPLFLSVVLVAGALGAVALAFFLHQIRPVFSTRKSLRELTGFPVLGSVSEVVSPIRLVERRRQSVIYASAIVLLILLFIGSVAFHEPVSLWARSLVATEIL